MSGMPTFGATHDDKTIWAITACVQCLPDMSAEQYVSTVDGTHHHENGEEDHHHEGE
jgi:hypothetical protein